jgi:hypothetical protein
MMTEDAQLFTSGHGIESFLSNGGMTEFYILRI